MKRKMLLLILKLAQRLGLFTLSRFLTARDIRILCYHGCALQDESAFSPGLFQTAETFERRMSFLSGKGYKVISLDEALHRLESKESRPDKATVITIDDGWYGSYKHQFPVLRKYAFPATIYISSYYLEKQTQVFNVALRYALWKTSKASIDLSDLGSGIDSATGEQGPVDKERAFELINGYADSLDGASDRQTLLREVFEALEVDYRPMEISRMFSFMTADEARQMAVSELDIQLHTHRHRFPIDMTFEDARFEIERNRQSLDHITRSPLLHFCYPSGYYSQRTKSYLPKLDIVSATTIKSGFNRKGASKLELKRFLDSERISDLEFEAEMSGFFELIRRTGFSV